MRRIILLLFSVLAFGCGRHATDSAVDQARKKWEAEGWTFLEVLGVPEPGAQEASFLSSETARSITAFAFDGAERKRKEYFQAEARFLVVTMEAKAGHTYALVFRRPKK